MKLSSPIWGDSSSCPHKETKLKTCRLAEMILASVLKGTGEWSHFPCDDVGQKAQEEDLVASARIGMLA